MCHNHLSMRPAGARFLSDQVGQVWVNLRKANNKKLNVTRHFQNKHTAFAQRYLNGGERKKAVLELMQTVDLSKN